MRPQGDQGDHTIPEQSFRVTPAGKGSYIVLARLPFGNGRSTGLRSPRGGIAMGLLQRGAGIPTIDYTLDILDKWLFLAVFLLGAISIAVLKSLAVPQLFVTGAPVALMLCYFLCVLFTPRFALRDDHASDNLYYLGFLFTLVSLGLALYEF